MTNPFTRRRQQTGIRVSYSGKVALENKERARDKEEREKASEAKLFESLYGQEEILSRVKDLTARPIRHQQYSRPIRGPVPPSPMPLEQLYYDPGCYELDTQMQAPQSARVYPPKYKSLKEGEVEAAIEAMKKQTVKKLVIPVTQNVVERQTVRPVKLLSSSARIPVPSAPPPISRSNSVELEDLKSEDNLNPLRSYVSIPEGQEIVKSVIPLYLFDDDGYDEGVQFPLPCCGYSPYSFNSETLEWRRCWVISYEPPMFKIMWSSGRRGENHKEGDDKVKEVARISLRFDFDDVDRFESRRIQAFIWRDRVENEMRLMTFLAAQSASQYGKPNPSLLAEIVKKIGVESPRVSSLLQEVVEQYLFGLKLGKYVEDCEYIEKRRAFLKKGFPILTLREHVPMMIKKLDAERIECLLFPEYELMMIIASRLELVRTTRKLLKPLTGNHNSDKLFEDLSRHVRQTVLEIEKDDWEVIEIQTRQLLLTWPAEQAERLLTLIDFRFAGALRDLVFEAFDAFETAFREHNAFLNLVVSSQITATCPAKDDVIEAGKNYLHLLLTCFDSTVSAFSVKGLHRDLGVQIDALRTRCNELTDMWVNEISASYDSLENTLQTIREVASSIPLKNFEAVEDLFSDPSDLIMMKAKLNNAFDDLSVLVDEYPHMQECGYLNVSFESLYRSLTNQTEAMRTVVCEYLTEKIFKLVDSVDRGINELKAKCEKPPVVIEDWYSRHLLLIDLKANFRSINDGLDSTMTLFEFLTDFSYESKVHVSMAYSLKSELLRLLNSLPEFLKQEQDDLVRLKEEHAINDDRLEEEIEELFKTIEQHHLKTDITQATAYMTSLMQLKEKFEDFGEQVAVEKRRDEMIELPVRSYIRMNDVERDLSMFMPLWKIVCEFDSQTQQWMSLPFLELSPNDFITIVKEWRKDLVQAKEKFEKIPSFSVGSVLIEEGKHPLLETFRLVEEKIDELISHIPIIQHLCNPVLRNRHWNQISELTGKSINQNEGLTWQWVIESGIEEKLSEIAKISRNATSEYQIEKALGEMLDEVRNLSVVLKKEEGHVKIDDTTKIFKVLSNHQVRIQEIFIPPHIKPFLMKIKEYDCLAGNLRTILNRTLAAQSTIDDLAPAMESQDIRTQSQSVSVNYDENVKVFNRLVTKFGDPSKFHDLISNPKYFSIIDDLQGNLKELKGDLQEIMAEKRKMVPQFRFLSDSQLIHLISHAQDPSKFDTIFAYIYPQIERALFEEMNCIGFRSIDGEEVKFLKPFVVTPASIETILMNFETSLVSTLTTMTFNLAKAGQISNVGKFVASTPSQIACLVYNLLFNNRVTKIFESAEVIFSERKASILSDQFSTLLDTINRDMDYLVDAAQDQPSAAISNLVTTLLKQRDIVQELIDKKAMNASSHSWLRHLRYRASGDSVENFTVTVSCGLHSCEYGFAYTGGGPIHFLTESRESIYSDFMISLTNSLNAIVIGSLHSFKTSFIQSFAQAIGKNCFVYSCSALNTVEMLTSIIDTVAVTGYFLIFRDFHHLTSAVVTGLAPFVMAYSKKGVKATQNVAICATYTSQSSNEIPTHIRLLFRPIMIQPPETEIVMSAFLTGIGLRNSADLCQKLVAVTDCLTLVADPRFYAIFSVTNLMVIISRTPVDKKNPELDIYNRLKAAVHDMNSMDSSVFEQLSAIFGVQDEDSLHPAEFDIPEDLMPSSPVVASSMREFIEMTRYHRDIIVLGPAMSGKTTLIKSASKVLKKSITPINPEAQSLEYMYSNKDKGLLFNALTSADWIVFDAALSDQWLNVLAVSMWKRSDLFFGDGTTMKIPSKVRFIYETDSLTYASPSTLSYFAMLVLPEDAVGYNCQLDIFMKKLASDERIVEAVSGKIIGTTIPVSQFTKQLREFLDQILEFLIVEISYFPLFSKRHAVSNFLKVFDSILSVHYYSNTRINTFDQEPLSEILDCYKELTIFAAAWSFGGMMINENREEFEDSLRQFANDAGVTMPEQSIFEFSYNVTKKCWQPWTQMKMSRFFESASTMSDLQPEYLELSSSQLIGSLYYVNLMISQGKNVILDCSEAKVNNIITNLAINTDYMGAHFSQFVYQYPNAQHDCDQNPLRKMIDQCLAGIRDGSRSTSRRPLLTLTSIDLTNSMTTELLRFALNTGYITNLETFSPEVTRSMRFLLATDLMGNVGKPINDRLLRHFSVLRISNASPETVEMAITRSLTTLCGIPNAEEVASIMFSYIYDIEGQLRFNFGHILKIIQRVAMVMEGYTPTFFLTALSYESVAVIYDAIRTDDSITKIDQMIQAVAKLSGVTSFEPVQTHCNTKILTNLTSNKFRPVGSMNEIASTTRLISPRMKMVSVRSMESLPQFRGSYIQNFNGMSVNLQPVEITPEDQRLILKLQRMFTTPKTHVLINTDMKFLAQGLVEKTAEIMRFHCSVFQTGTNMLKLIHDHYVNAGMLQRHQIIYVNEQHLAKSDLLLVKTMIESPNIFELFGPNEILMILSEIHCKSEEDPFHEETLESKSNYHMLVRDFLRDCGNYFHFCIVSSEESNSFKFFFNHCETIIVSKKLSAMIRQSSHFAVAEMCKFDATTASDILMKLRDEQTNAGREIRLLPMVRSITSIYNGLYEEVSKRHDDRYQILEQLSHLAVKTEETMAESLKKQMEMEEKVSAMARELEELMNKTKEAQDKALIERKKLEAEEQILNAQQQQAELLRKESEASLAAAKPLLMQSSQELRQLSARDISVIKTMNHPTKGVFLVMRSIVLAMGHKIEDKTDEPSGTQPSFVLGKKLLTDTSFVSNLMKRTLEGPRDEIVTALRPLVADPNFEPSIVAKSSTAAKSICQFIRAIVPYYEALSIYEAKQEELRVCQEHLKQLQKKHEMASGELHNANKEFEEIEARSRNLELNKLRVEEQLQMQKQNVERHKSSLNMMKRFFDDWNQEMQEMSEQRMTLEMRTYFTACCLALYGSFSAEERDDLFESVKRVFEEMSITSIDSRAKLADLLALNFTLPPMNYGLKPSVHFIENLSLFALPMKKWYFVVDGHHMITSVLKPIVDKRIVITSYAASNFHNDLLNALLGNEFLIIYDYPVESNDPVFYQIYANRGNKSGIEVSGRQVEVPTDFQIVFIVFQCPSTSYFEGLCVELLLTDDEITSEVSTKIYTALDPERSQTALSAERSTLDSKSELQKTRTELQNVLLQNEDNVLDNDKVYKQFVGASNVFNRLTTQIEKLKEINEASIAEYRQVQETMGFKFADLYRSKQPRDGIHHFYAILNEVLGSMEVGGVLSERADEVYSKLREKLTQLEVSAVAFEERMRRICRDTPIELGEYCQTINEVVEKHSEDIICLPNTIIDVIESSNCRRPILIHGSHYLLKYLANSDRIILAAPTKCLDGFNEALRNSKGLVTMCNSMSLFPYLLSVISKIRSATSISHDFRFYIFTDVSTDNVDFPSVLLDFCDFVDVNGITSIRTLMSFSMSSLPVGLYDTTFSGKTNFWRRVLFLLAFYDAAANLMALSLFQDIRFNEDNLELMIQYIRDIENPNLRDLGPLLVPSLYCVEQNQMKTNLLRIWDILFTPENLENTAICLFDKYNIPVLYPPSQVFAILSKFPLVDESRVYGMPPDSDHHFRKFEEMQWKDTRFGRLNFTSIELKPIDVSNTVWYLVNEAEEVNKRFLHNQHKFDRSLRVLLQKLRSPAPVVDLSVMFHPIRFFGLLQFKYLLESKCDPAKIVFLLTTEKTEIAVENLVMINAGCEEDGKFVYLSGSRVLPRLYIKVCQVEPGMVKVLLYRRGAHIGSFHVFPKNVLPMDSVFLLTAFTTPLK